MQPASLFLPVSPFAAAVSRYMQSPSPSASLVMPAAPESSDALQRRHGWWQTVSSQLWLQQAALYLQPAYEALVAAAMLGCLCSPSALQTLAASALYSDILPVLIAAIAILLTAALLSVLCAFLTCWAKVAAVLRRDWRVAFCCTLTPQLMTGFGATPLLVILPAIPLPDSTGQAALLLLLWLVSVTQAAVCVVALLLSCLQVALAHRLRPLSCPWMPAWYGQRDDALHSLEPLQPRDDVNAALQSIPPVKYRSNRGGDAGDDDEDLCAICIQQMKEGDSVRRFSCRHCFHAGCVDNWLVRRLSCPLCLAIVDLPTPAAAAETESVELTPPPAAV